jgi:hypothetical protein
MKSSFSGTVCGKKGKTQAGTDGRVRGRGEEEAQEEGGINKGKFVP